MNKAAVKAVRAVLVNDWTPGTLLLKFTAADGTTVEVMPVEGVKATRAIARDMKLPLRDDRS